MSLNTQRFVRTGDKVVVKSTKEKGTVHYVLGKREELSFEEQVRDITKLLVSFGGDIRHLLPTEVAFH